MSRVVAAALLAAATLCSIPGSAQTPSSGLRIVPVARDLFMASSGGQNTVYYVTPQGIVLADPVSVSFSERLKVELTRRHPNRPVRFVLHSDHHAEHAAGADVWTSSAEVIAHERFTPELRQAALAHPAAYAGVRPPESTFAERRRITLGGRPVDVIHSAAPDAADRVFLHFPEARVVFAIDPSLPAVAAVDADVIVPGRGEMVRKTRP